MRRKKMSMQTGNNAASKSDQSANGLHKASALTQQYASFIESAASLELPDEASQRAITGFIDTIGTMIAGRDEPVVGIVREWLGTGSAAQGSAAQGLAASSVLMGSERASAEVAAWINGAAAHALDFDDVALGGHPSTVLVPAIMAEAQRLNRSGRDVVTAYLVGYEVWADLVNREKGSHHLKGWHPTAVFGVIGAAAACGFLNRDTAQICQMGLAIAGSFAAGLVANFGTMTKPFHAGMAASHGISAMRLARLGMTATPDAMEHHAGFLKAISEHNDVDRFSPADSLGKPWKILHAGLSIKRYPLCYATHRVIDGVLALRDQHHLKPDDVESVEAVIGVAQASMLRNHQPSTGLEAKFSLQFAIASALVEGAVGLNQLTDQVVAKPDVREQFSKLKISITEQNCPIEPAFSYADRVRLKLRNGSMLDTGEIRFAKGNAMNPLSLEELEDKFLDCASRAHGVDGKRIFDQLANLTSLGSIQQLTNQ
ncbi:MAG: MmgE/PrpD family protein [Betaproteobacteria bacterium]|jgi:2-methylcitrate dehydratase PrpD|nr:MmgE/PrpD family protein [Betaproteobacteria bacterium]NDE91938.1 MmgE/PrpD family protein [Betaproteobacteria bacterium]